MGKKKASMSNKLRPVLEKAIKESAVFVRELKNFAVMNYDDEAQRVYDPYDRYEIAFINDYPWWDDSDITECITMSVTIHNDGKFEYSILSPNRAGLSRYHESWFLDQLGQIIVMAKLGAYPSAISGDRYASRGKDNHYMSAKRIAEKNMKKRKKK